ncbi:MAG: hypothetical protein AAGG08_14335, partial [Actinomycetota bacterium]
DSIATSPEGSDPGGEGSGPVGDSIATSPEGSDPGGEGVPAILEFSAPLVGGGDFDAAATAGTPTAFWFWAPT